MSLALSYSPFLLLLFLVVAGALAYWAYRGTVPALPTGRRALLSGLRFLALGIIIFLLFEPVARNLLRNEQPPVLAVLVDNSQSIPVTSAASGGGADSLQGQVQTLVRGLVARQTRRQDEGELEIFAFDAETAALPEEAVDSLDFSGVRTDITQGLTSVASVLENRNLGGVLLLTDGQYNTGRNPLYAADRYPVPIYTVALGDTARRKDVQVYQVTTNEITYTGEELPVEVTLRAEHSDGATVQVALLRGGEVLDRQAATLPEASGERTLTLAYTPDEVGLHHLGVRVSTLPGEQTTRNNEQRVAVRVLDSKKQVLLLAAAPGPDVGGIRRLLLQDERLSVASFVQQRPGAFYEGALPEDLSEADALVLVGWPGEAAEPATMRRVAGAIEAGLPVLFLMTQQTDLAALGQYLGDVLPAHPAEPAERFAEAQPVLSPAGLRHPVVGEIDPAQLRRLPPLMYSPSRWQASPDARILATLRVQGVALDDPMLAVRSRSGHRSAAWLGAGAWRWVTLPQDLEEAASVWPTLLSNMLQWVTTPEDDRRVRIAPVRDFFGGGEDIRFAGQVYDESLEPVGDASVAVTISNEQGQTFPFEMRPDERGRYVLDAGTLPEGSYRYAAVARRDGTQLGTDEGVFSVGDLTLEYRELRADVDLLRQIAARSGGQFFFPDSLGGLTSALASSETFAPKFLEEQREVPLWHLYALLGVIVLLLCAEWFTRKRLGLV